VADRNLLLGILALQMDFIDRDQLIGAMNGWVLAKSRPLAQFLADQGALRADARSLLEALVDKQLELHDNDPEKSLAALSSIGSVREALKHVGDADVQASLTQAAVGQSDDEDALRRRDLSVGESSSGGLRFRILRPHARGGVGEVFVAHDEELHREVALKQIQDLHADNPHSRSRFVMEAEITGGLEHPGIVPIYGLGQYADGRPFYAMRFIKGDSLKDVIKRFHESKGKSEGEGTLEFRKLLGRFVDVCNAVAYAHARGVLHRDLKPGNVMLGKYGETLLVDWGLAKTMHERRAKGERIEIGDEQTLRPRAGSGSAPTVLGTALGTPAYMSPEQAAGRLEQLGPATDIYSLGATLYALLTGQAPYKRTDDGEILQQVQKGGFPRPRVVKAGVQAALEAVCLKAMARRPEDRYRSARALADDIEHWLADEPVQAYVEPWRERARRWRRRHRALVTGLTASMLVAVAALGLGVVLLMRANQTERSLRTEAVVQRERAEANAQRALAAATAEKQAKETALAREGETKAVLDFVEQKVFAAARPKDEEGGLGHSVTLRKALESALPWVDKSLKDRPLVEARLRRTLGLSFRYLGDVEIARGQFERALELSKARLGPDHPDTLKNMGNLANNYDQLGRHAEAVKLYEETLTLMKAKLGPDHLDTLRTMSNLGNSYGRLDRNAEALKLREETLRLFKAKLGPEHPLTLVCMNNLANSYDAAGRYAEALKLRVDTLACRKAKLGSDHPQTLDSMNNLGNSYYKIGRYADALKLHEETLALKKTKIGADHPETLRSMGNLARSYFALGRNSEALKLGEQALALEKSKLGADHPDTVETMILLARVHLAEKRPAQAKSLLVDALGLIQKSQGADTVATARVQQALGGCYVHEHKFTEAEPVLRSCLATQENRQPDSWEAYHTQSLLGGALLGEKKYAEAEPLLIGGYEGMKQRETKIEMPERLRITEAGQRLVQLYDAWGKQDKADEWRARLRI
jgi:serine/threonine protein kinase